MKKILSLLIVISCFAPPFANAFDEISEVNVPKWEEYVPKKYQNPRNDFTKGGSIAEMASGIVLTDLLITAPIGIPMICHSATKLKNKGYFEKKIKFEEGLKEAEKIEDPKERQLFYDNLIVKCNLSEKRRQKFLKKEAKKQAEKGAV